MAVENNPARSFVNRIINGYDNFCHRGTPNIPDIFNPQLEEGLKENSLAYFVERFSNPPQQMTAAELDAEVVATYKESAPTLSHLVALTGMLEAPLQDPSLQQTQLRIIEAVAQDHLRNKEGYELDPMALMMQTATAGWKDETEFLPQFVDGRKRFYAEVFQEVFSRCGVKSKRSIIKQLQHFEPVLNTQSSQFQREVFKVERTVNDYLTNSEMKFLASIACGVVSYLAVNKTVALAGQVFASPAFISFSTGVISRMPVVIVQILSGAYTRIMGVVSFVVSSQLYQLKIGTFQVGPSLICKIFPTMSWFLFPASTFAMRLFSICYPRAFGPDAIVQMGISKALEVRVSKNKCTAEEANELLEGGMKAYQVWMYLVEQGPQKELFAK